MPLERFVSLNYCIPYLERSITKKVIDVLAHYLCQMAYVVVPMLSYLQPGPPGSFMNFS